MTTLKMARFMKGISQEELARKIGVDQPAISRLELDKDKDTPRILRLKKAVAEFLDIPVTAIFPGTKDDGGEKSQ